MRWSAVLLAALALWAATGVAQMDLQDCRRAPRPPLLDGSERRQDPDGITRTNGNNCRDRFNNACDLCCDGSCCEDFTGISGANPTEQHWIPIRIAVVSRGNTTHDQLFAVGSDGLTQMDEQVQALNRVFQQMNVWFYIDTVVTFNDSRMVTSCQTDPCYTTPLCDFYEYTMPRIKGNSSAEALLVICDEITFLGEAQYPWAAAEDTKYQYLMVHHKVVGIDGPGWASGLGHTMVHEFGHYFGLFHPFHSNCDGIGDWVDDTPQMRISWARSRACDDTLDTCPNQPGVDQSSNFMNYATDLCMTQFTSGQWNRMRQGVRRYRPLLMATTAVPFGSCPPTAHRIDQCSCSNGASPQNRCQIEETTTTSTVAQPPTPVVTVAPVESTPAPTTTNPPPPTPAPTTAAPARDSGSDGLSATEVAAIVGGTVLAVVIVFILTCAVCTRASPKAAEESSASGGSRSKNARRSEADRRGDQAPTESRDAQPRSRAPRSPAADAQTGSPDGAEAASPVAPPLAKAKAKRRHERVNTEELADSASPVPAKAVPKPRKRPPVPPAVAAAAKNPSNDAGAAASSEPSSAKLTMQGSAIPQSEFSDVDDDDDKPQKPEPKGSAVPSARAVDDGEDSAAQPAAGVETRAVDVRTPSPQPPADDDEARGEDDVTLSVSADGDASDGADGKPVDDNDTGDTPGGGPDGDAAPPSS